MVPRLRTCGSPTEAATAARPGNSCCSTDEMATSAWRDIAPITIERPFCSTPERPSTNDRSISADGFASRCFITGISEWPPASSLASGLRANRPAAWRTGVGAWELNLYIVISLKLCGLAHALRALECRPYRLRSGRHGQFLGSDGVGDCVDHRGGRRDRAGLTAALDAEGVGPRTGLGP